MKLTKKENKEIEALSILASSRTITMKVYEIRRLRELREKERGEEEKEDLQGRGQLTDRIKAKSLELLGYEINVRELRLMAYLQYTMTNDHRMPSSSLIIDEEKKIFIKWMDLEYIKEIDSITIITKKFWDIINEILYLGYVNINIKK